MASRMSSSELQGRCGAVSPRTDHLENQPPGSPLAWFLSWGCRRSCPRTCSSTAAPGHVPGGVTGTSSRDRPPGVWAKGKGHVCSRLVHPRSESGLQHWSSPCWELPTPLATRPRQRAQQEVGLPWFLPDTSHPSSHILSLIPGLGSWPTPQGVVSPPRRKLWAFLVLIPTQCPAVPAAGVRCSPASGAPKSRLAMGRCLGGFAGSDSFNKDDMVHQHRRLHGHELEQAPRR